MITHIFEDVCLQIAICDEDCAPAHIFECLLKGLDHLLHSFEWRLAIQDLKYVLIDHLNFFDVDLLIATAKGTKRCHRMNVSIFQ